MCLVLLALLAGMVAAVEARATLFEIDLSTLGDGLVTRDDTTGLLWLDVGLTDGLSYNDVVNGDGNSWYTEGWRHATTTEMCGLFEQYVIVLDPCPDPDVSPLPFGAADYLLSFMEPNSESGDPIALNGTFDDGLGSVGQGAIATSPVDQIVVQAPNGISSGVRNLATGNWLVRPIPEPRTSLLVTSGLVGLAWKRRRIRHPIRYSASRVTFQRLASTDSSPAATRAAGSSVNGGILRAPPPSESLSSIGRF